MGIYTIILDFYINLVLELSLKFTDFLLVCIEMLKIESFLENLHFSLPVVFN